MVFLDCLTPEVGQPATSLHNYQCTPRSVAKHRKSHAATPLTACNRNILDQQIPHKFYQLHIAQEPAIRLYTELYEPSHIQKSNPVTGLEWPRWFQGVKVPRLHDNGTGWW